MNSEERMGLKKFMTKQIMSDEELLRAISIDKSDFLNNAYVLSPAYEIAKNRIYQYKFFKDIKTEQESFMCFSISLRKEKGKLQTKTGEIEFFIFTHVDLMKTNYPYTRIDFIASRIDKLFNMEGTTDVIKKIQFVRDEEISYNSSFVGYMVKYSFDSFNTDKVISYAT